MAHLVGAEAGRSSLPSCPLSWFCALAVPARAARSGSDAHTAPALAIHVGSMDVHAPEPGGVADPPTGRRLGPVHNDAAASAFRPASPVHGDDAVLLRPRGSSRCGPRDRAGMAAPATPRRAVRRRTHAPGRSQCRYWRPAVGRPWSGGRRRGASLASVRRVRRSPDRECPAARQKHAPDAAADPGTRAVAMSPGAGHATARPRGGCGAPDFGARERACSRVCRCGVRLAATVGPRRCRCAHPGRSADRRAVCARCASTHARRSGGGPATARRLDGVSKKRYMRSRGRSREVAALKSPEIAATRACHRLLARQGRPVLPWVLRRRYGRRAAKCLLGRTVQVRPCRAACPTNCPPWLPVRGNPEPDRCQQLMVRSGSSNAEVRRNVGVRGGMAPLSG